MHKQPRWFWLVLWLWPLTAHAQDAFTLTAASLQNGQAVELDKLGWKYSPNDDPRFAEPQFDDRAWETLNNTLIKFSSVPQSGWRGIGWFRLHLRVAPELVSVPLNLEMFHLGASEIYLNGKQIGRFGVVSTRHTTEIPYEPNALPLGIVFPAETGQVIAVRYSNQQAADLNSFRGNWQLRFYEGIGFSSRIRRFDQATNQGADNVYGFSYNLFQGAFALALGILHFLLFIFLPRQRANLFYSIFLLGLAANNFLMDVSLKAHYGMPAYYLLQVITWSVAFLYQVSLLAFVYTAFCQRILQSIWVFLTAGVIGVALVAIRPGPAYWQVYGLLIIAISLESLRVIYGAFRQQRDGALLVGISLLFYFVMALRTFFDVFIQHIQGFWFVVMDVISWYGMMLTISIHLAREFARTNKSLEKQLVQVKQLSAAALEHEKVKAEHDRKTKELEEARQLQLSMLPKKLPQLPHLDIAAYMKTASEVGGDYYDFHTSDDGTLTIAVGDATGHGLKAGTMVASVKSLFVTLAYHPDIPHIFTRLSQTLKQMNLRGLFMAMTIAKVKENRLTISLAGMPPVWLYRAAAQQIEDIALQQLPLGGVTKYVYQQREYELASGDVVVLLSDGLPERFNPTGEMLEDEAAKQWLTEHAQLPAQALIAGLAKLGDEWGGARPQDDDVTLVVLKVK